MSPMTKQMGEPTVAPAQPTEPESRMARKPNLATAASLVFGTLLIGIVLASAVLSG